MSKNVEWTLKIQDAFEELLGREENLSYRRIAAILTEQFNQPFTSNACIGRAHRMKLPPRPPRPRTEARARPSRKVVTMPVRVDAPIVPKEAYHPKNGRDLAMIQLREGDCRWPSEGDTPPYTYCGKPTMGRVSFCPEHYVIAYHPAKKTFA